VNLLSSSSRQRSNTDEVTPSNLSDNALVYDNKEVVLIQNGNINMLTEGIPVMIGDFVALTELNLGSNQLTGVLG
jgi:hypothetical protein